MNQGQTYREERDGGYLWSPKRARNGSRRPYYDAMTQTALDDVVVHYVSHRGALIGVSVVSGPVRSEEQPAELRRTDMWDDDGWLVPVVHVESVAALPRDVALEMGPREAPFASNGTVKQGYLYPLTPPYGQSLLAALDPAAVINGGEDEIEAVESDPVETTSLESGRRITFEQAVTPGRRAAVRAEWQLVDHIVRDFGLDPVRRRYRLPSGADLASDLWVPQTRLLVEAKASASRNDIRQAIGQLYDYAQKESGAVVKMIVLPERPAADLLTVLRTADIQSVWLEDGTWTGDVGAEYWGSTSRDQ